MTHADARPAVELSTSTAHILATAFTGLAEARSEVDLLNAVLVYLRPLGPFAADLLLTTVFAGNVPTHARIVAHWSESEPVEACPRDIDIDLGSHLSISQLWYDQSTPVLLEDIAADPRCDDAYRRHMVAIGVAAQAMLPLHSEAVGRVIGVVVLHFRAPRQFTSEERYVLKTLSCGLASFLASRRLLAEREESLRQAERQRQMLQAVLENLPVGVYLAEAGTHKPLLANRIGVETLGKSRVEPDGKVYYEAYTTYRQGTTEPLPFTELPLYQTLATGEPRTGVVDVVSTEGRGIVTLELSAAPVRDDGGAMFAAVVVYLDVTERNRIDAERTQIRDELIRTQAQALAERSTPLIPLGDDLVAMPLVGALDGPRADQIIEVLLAGCAARKARWAILDVTGVPHADTAVAGALLRAAAAVRLLGVEPILTGIRPDVARTLVGLDVDLRGVVTLSTLQEGIQYAARTQGRSR
ncbi:STAS domain-containing protein [Nannocystis radixulma]|uniref:STAS domain-containing protein n=1 Tax=Nannocystis radixulma TaxID=2995305 RepID=A0ABT5AZ62_9BACT|nr:STAS domain-containing protein [Nannocystis radixulma]MDC0667130.1 STAS domain-containing protein [Nannocystis radixulma]